MRRNSNGIITPYAPDCSTYLSNTICIIEMTKCYCQRASVSRPEAMGSVAESNRGPTNSGRRFGLGKPACGICQNT